MGISPTAILPVLDSKAVQGCSTGPLWRSTGDRDRHLRIQPWSATSGITSALFFRFVYQLGLILELSSEKEWSKMVSRVRGACVHLVILVHYGHTVVQNVDIFLVIAAQANSFLCIVKAYFKVEADLCSAAVNTISHVTVFTAVSLLVFTAAVQWIPSVLWWSGIICLWRNLCIYQSLLCVWKIPLMVQGGGSSLGSETRPEFILFIILLPHGVVCLVPPSGTWWQRNECLQIAVREMSEVGMLLDGFHCDTVHVSGKSSPTRGWARNPWSCMKYAVSSTIPGYSTCFGRVFSLA